MPCHSSPQLTAITSCSTAHHWFSAEVGLEVLWINQYIFYNLHKAVLNIGPACPSYNNDMHNEKFDEEHLRRCTTKMNAIIQMTWIFMWIICWPTIKYNRLLALAWLSSLMSNNAGTCMCVRACYSSQPITLAFYGHVLRRSFAFLKREKTFYLT